MRIVRSDTPNEHVVVVSGDVGAAETAELRTHLMAALADGDHDVLLDARGMTAFDDAVMSALTIARLRARSAHHRLVVLDAQAGALSLSLHRTGMLDRFPVHPNVDAATAALADDRARLAAMDSPLEATSRSARDHERTARLEHQAAEHAGTTST